MSERKFKIQAGGFTKQITESTAIRAARKAANMFVKNQQLSKQLSQQLSQQSHDLEFDLNVKEVGKKKTLTYKAKLDNGKVIVKRGGEGPDPSDFTIVKQLTGNIFDKVTFEERALELEKKAIERVVELNKRLENLIENTQLKLNTVGEQQYRVLEKGAKFAVVTYWWGKGNINRNFLNKCLEDQPANVTANVTANANAEATLEYRKSHGNQDEGKKYEEMIVDWAKTCAKNGCPFIVQEYPDFTIPKGYQVAINAKPYFIRKALDLAVKNGLQGVVYIDGDMSVNRFPSIFNTENVDFMARGWNIDPRSTRQYLDNNMQYDPWAFETSGGIMYFGNTYGGHTILDQWIRANQRPVHAGKADDRILSLIFNYLGMFIPFNTIQLPIEYLWLTDIYGTRTNKLDIRVKNKTGKDTGFIVEKDAGPVVIEHPACLTSEERAADQGASENRSTTLYHVVEDRISYDDSFKGKYTFYEHIFFDEGDDDGIKSYKKYNAFMSGTEIFWNVLKEHTYGYHTDDVKKNIDKIITTEGRDKEMEILTEKLHAHPLRPPVSILSNAALKNSSGNKLQSFYVIKQTADTNDISRILTQLMKGENVVFIPSACPGHTKVAKENKKYILKFLDAIPNFCEFAACINERSDNNKLYDFNPEFDMTKPLFFSFRSRILRQLLLMCTCVSPIKGESHARTLKKQNFSKPGQIIIQDKTQEISTDFNSVFNSSFIFLSRIRCTLLEDFKDS